MGNDEPFAEQMISRLAEVLQGERPIPSHADSMEGVRNALRGFIESSPRAVERVVGGPTFRELKASLTTNRTATNRLVAVQSGTLGGTARSGDASVPPRPVWSDGDENASNEHFTEREETRMRTTNDGLAVHEGDAGDFEYVPPPDPFAENEEATDEQDQAEEGTAAGGGGDDVPEYVEPPRVW